MHMKSCTGVWLTEEVTEIHKALDRLSLENCLIALDRDGTLVPYSERPEEAQVTPEIRELIHALAERPGVHVALISARSVAQLQSDFDYRRVILAGNYGLEVLLTDGSSIVQAQAIDAVPFLKTVRDELFASLDRTSNAILEDHGYSLCLHWHRVPLSHRDALHLAVSEVISRHRRVRFRKLPTSYEVLPAFTWDKGMALAAICDHLGIGGNGDDRGARYATSTPLFFAGDSDADSPAFEWINARNGISIRVGVPDLLGAQFSVPDPADLHKMLVYVNQRRS
jgi:trehalose 6-phosphate phosphatase